MDSRQLSYFVVAARREHLGAAAAELGISEPALSRSIGRLEHQFGVQFFDRIGRGLRLNTYGKLLLAHSERAFAELDLCHEKIRSLHAGADLVTIGFIPSLGVSIIPRVVSNVARVNASIQLRFHEGRGPALRTLLLDGDIDLYLGTLLFPDPAITWHPAWDEGVVAVMPRGHRLAERAEVELQEIASDHWLVLRSAGTTRRALVDAARNLGFAADVVFESDDFATILGLVEAGHGVALLPEHCSLAGSALKAVPLRSSPRRIIGVGHSRSRSMTQTAIAVRDVIIAEVGRWFSAVAEHA